MDLTRRHLLRAGAVAGGAAATVPLLGSLSESAIASTTATQTWTFGPPNAKGYQKLVPGPPEARNVRTGLGASPTSSPSSCRTPLLAFAQFSDIHVVDHQSPGRVEWLDRFEDPNDLGLNVGLLSSSYRAWETLSAHVSDAMVRAVNDIATGPVTDLPLSFMIETGDNSDNCQK